MPSSNEIFQKRFTLWINYGTEGWKPEGFDTIKEALEADKYTTEWIITENIRYVVSKA